MESAILIVLAMVAASMGVSWINRRHDARRAVRVSPADDQVTAAWEDFGDDDGEADTAFENLVSAAPVATLASKTAVSRMAVMALRAGRHDLLPALAERADELGRGCGEAKALAVLAAAWAGDLTTARKMYVASQQAMAGCASCGAEASVKILLQEAQFALSADGGS